MTPSPSLMNVGAIAGFAFPAFPLRIWGGYNFISNFSGITVSGFPGFTMGGTSFMAGIGYKILPFLSIDVEGYLPTMTTLGVGGVSVPLAANLTGKYILASISIPLSF